MAADCWCEISAGHIISVFREIVQEEVTRSVVIGHPLWLERGVRFVESKRLS